MTAYRDREPAFIEEIERLRGEAASIAAEVEQADRRRADGAAIQRNIDVLEDGLRRVRGRRLVGLRIAERCTKKWAELTPTTEGDGVRFCSKCDQRVFDLTRMTQDQIGAFVVERDGAPTCAKLGSGPNLYARPDGGVVTRDCTRGVGPRGAGALALGMLGLAGTALGVGVLAAPQTVAPTASATASASVHPEVTAPHVEPQPPHIEPAVSVDDALEPSVADETLGALATDHDASLDVAGVAKSNGVAWPSREAYTSSRSVRVGSFRVPSEGLVDGGAVGPARSFRSTDGRMRLLFIESAATSGAPKAVSDEAAKLGLAAEKHDWLPIHLVDAGYRGKMLLAAVHDPDGRLGQKGSVEGKRTLLFKITPPGTDADLVAVVAVESLDAKRLLGLIAQLEAVTWNAPPPLEK
jgi:hypothetical protein